MHACVAINIFVPNNEDLCGNILSSLEVVGLTTNNSRSFDSKLCVHTTIVAANIILPNNQDLCGNILGWAKVIAPTTQKSSGASTSSNKFGL